MQAVAEALGVDPKALNYHVGDREGLRALVAFDVFATELRRVELPADGDWRLVVRSYAAALRDAFIRLGVLATSFHLPAASGLGALAPVERVLRSLLDAGFDVEQAGRALTLITETAYTAGRAAVLVAQNRVHPNVPEVVSALQGAASDDFPVLREVLASREGQTPDHGQLEFDLTVVIAGLERVLAPEGGASTPVR
ncbi:TetR family transcriptional regulator [Mycolicibacterium madagascariense]|uniref:TetR family transcriptional regulator n=2 Tax=Mycolicibacterium madagascariense TaxID=212765 RepID=A0A7I7XEC4_9MYCO|nr:TetR family transcriptional regulator [Mycolicibacterium madagascariense]